MSNKGEKGRPDLLYRNIAESLDSEDPRIAEINERVIDYMAATSPEDWTKEQWQLFRVIYQKSSTKRKKPTALAEMSSDALKASLAGNQ